MNIQTWYGSSIKIPSRKSYRYAGFAASCIGIVRSILRKKLDREVAVRFAVTSTALADVENSTIVISASFLDGFFGQEKLGKGAVNSNEALSAILGVIVHEAAHFAYSFPTLENYGEFIRLNTARVFDHQIALVTGNIIEDIFIEAEVVRNVPSIGWMLDSMNEVMMDEDVYLLVTENAMSLESAPEDARGVRNCLDTILLAKFYDSVNINHFMNGLFNQALLAKDLIVLEDREKLALSLYETIMEKMTEEKCQESKPIEESKKLVIGATADRTKPNNKAVTAIYIDSNARSVNRVLERIGDAIVEIPPEGDGGCLSYVEKRMPLRPNPIPIDQRYLKLAEYTRQRSTTNRPYGQQLNRGHSIRQLYRIGTDQKIFAQKITLNDFKPMQVVILIDYSGSMMADVHGGVRKPGCRSVLDTAIEAAAGAAYGLAEGRCQVAVYGHTGDVVQNRDVFIYNFKTFSESISHLVYRLDPNSYGGVDSLTQENRDGCALEYIAKKFTSNNRKKLLIHISDGSPMADDYWGQKANDHVRTVVDGIRAKGITVLSISITEEAAEVNDYIYGSKWNVFNTDPNVIEGVVRHLFD